MPKHAVEIPTNSVCKFVKRWRELTFQGTLLSGESRKSFVDNMADTLSLPKYIPQGFTDDAKEGEFMHVFGTD